MSDAAIRAISSVHDRAAGKVEGKEGWKTQLLLSDKGTNLITGQEIEKKEGGRGKGEGGENKQLADACCSRAQSTHTHCIAFVLCRQQGELEDHNNKSA